MIHIENLTKYYNTTCALDHINLEMNKGEILGLLGPNGAGKTTTLRILTCYMRPTEGTITIKDYNIFEHPLEIKKMIGYLPESAPLYKHMFVDDYLNYVADVREIPGEKKAGRIRELANLCGISDVMHKTIDELSKGYKQRVGLAHAMMSDPEILVLDEPTSGLDPNQRIEVRDIIREIGKTKTIIVSTHILPEVESTCDRVVIINRGKIVADDRLQNLKSSMGHEYHVHLELQRASFDAVNKAFSGISGVEKVRKAGEKDGILGVDIVCKTEDDLRPQIYGELRKSDWVLLELMKEQTSLETVFRKLTMEV